MLTMKSRVVGPGRSREVELGMTEKNVKKAEEEEEEEESRGKATQEGTLAKEETTMKHISSRRSVLSRPSFMGTMAAAAAVAVASRPVITDVHTADASREECCRRRDLKPRSPRRRR